MATRTTTVPDEDAAFRANPRSAYLTYRDEELCASLTGSRNQSLITYTHRAPAARWHRPPGGLASPQPPRETPLAVLPDPKPNLPTATWPMQKRAQMKNLTRDLTLKLAEQFRISGPGFPAFCPLEGGGVGRTERTNISTALQLLARRARALTGESWQKPCYARDYTLHRQITSWGVLASRCGPFWVWVSET